MEFGERIAVTVSVVEHPAGEFHEMLGARRPMITIGVLADTITTDEPPGAGMAERLEIGRSHLLVGIRKSTPSDWRDC
jgi:hypothetical protein